MSTDQALVITRPDDWHLHLRDGPEMAAVVGHSAERFARAIVMPNLKPPVTSTAQALAYRARILAAVPEGLDFEPLMTLYLTDNLRPEEIAVAKDSGRVYAAKLYPAGATTNSESGVTDIRRIYGVLEAMERTDLPLLVHGEVTAPEVDIFDRERRFIDDTLEQLVRDFPGLRIVFEHLTTADAVDFVRSGPAHLAATITPHHLLYNRNAMLAGGVRPHFYCLPVLKRERHRQALLAAATSGNPKFFLGTDSAPHPIGGKESACGCAGIYNAHAAIELYAEAFEQAGALDRLEGFASRFGADFYRLPQNTGDMRLTREPWEVPASYAFGKERLVPLRAGEHLNWRLVS
ncbi:MAG: dihydroorotase [Chromatiaceae bacterium]|jgi:dihydroorotase|nr:dihydroorotase [Chromatiaceae bacterium]